MNLLKHSRELHAETKRLRLVLEKNEAKLLEIINDLLKEFPSEQTSLPKLDVLSKKENQVFQLIGKGFSAEEISERLKKSRKTVEAQREAIKKKLNIETVAKLEAYAAGYAGDVN